MFYLTCADHDHDTCGAAANRGKLTNETHEVAQRKIEQLDKLKSALGIDGTMSEGDAFNRELQVRVGKAGGGGWGERLSYACCRRSQNCMQLQIPLQGHTVDGRCKEGSWAVTEVQGNDAYHHTCEYSMHVLV